MSPKMAIPGTVKTKVTHLISNLTKRNIVQHGHREPLIPLTNYRKNLTK